MPGTLLTTQELSDLLRVDVGTIRRWTREGKLPHLRIGPKTVRFSWPAVMQAMEAEQQRPSSDACSDTMPEPLCSHGERVGAGRSEP